MGTRLGIYASLTVLLRHQCRVERVETVIEALAYPADSPPPDVLVVDLASTGQSADAIPESERTRRERISSSSTIGANRTLP